MRKRVSGPGTLTAIQEALPTTSKPCKEMYGQVLRVAPYDLHPAVNPSASTPLASANFPDLYYVSFVSARGPGNLTAAYQTSAHPKTISESILKKWSTKHLAGISMAEDRKREFAQFGIDPDQVLKKIRRTERSLEDDSDDL
ncbi:hypothetical protein ElyMa_004625400 [Elysia marginata]|uniref:Uncharacterized protein n=1 Tax=Elysia marginata TaxID=1093978 RepID=A0AAV4HYY9_9GAST|nr:hypothetical protein ElyMa_004625400 [Elysia marginata]